MRHRNHHVVRWRHAEEQEAYEGFLMDAVREGRIKDDTPIAAEDYIRVNNLRGMEVHNNDYDAAFYADYRERLREIQSNPNAGDLLWLARNFVTPNEFAADRRACSGCGPEGAFEEGAAGGESVGPTEEEGEESATEEDPDAPAPTGAADPGAIQRAYFDPARERVEGLGSASKQSLETQKRLLALKEWAHAQIGREELRPAVLASGAHDEAPERRRRGVVRVDAGRTGVRYDDGERDVREFSRGIALRARNKKDAGADYSEVPLVELLARPDDFEYADPEEEKFVRDLADVMGDIRVVIEGEDVPMDRYLSEETEPLAVRDRDRPSSREAPNHEEPRTEEEAEEAVAVPPTEPAPPPRAACQDLPDLDVHDHRPGRGRRKMKFAFDRFVALTSRDGSVKAYDPVAHVGYLLGPDEALPNDRVLLLGDYLDRACRGNVCCRCQRCPWGVCGCCDPDSCYGRVRARLAGREHHDVRVVVYDTETGRAHETTLEEFASPEGKATWVLIASPEADIDARDAGEGSGEEGGGGEDAASAYAPLASRAFQQFSDGVKHWWKAKVTGVKMHQLSKDQFDRGSEIALDVYTSAGFLPGHRFAGSRGLSTKQRVEKLPGDEHELLYQWLAYLDVGLEGKLKGVTAGAKFESVLAGDVPVSTGARDGLVIGTEPDVTPVPRRLYREEVDRGLKDHADIGEDAHRNIVRKYADSEAWRTVRPLSSGARDAPRSVSVRSISVDGLPYREYVLGRPSASESAPADERRDATDSASASSEPEPEPEPEAEPEAEASEAGFVDWLRRHRPGELDSSVPGQRRVVLIPSEALRREYNVEEAWRSFVLVAKPGAGGPEFHDLEGQSVPLDEADVSPESRPRRDALLRELESGRASAYQRPTVYLRLESFNGIF